MFETSYQEMSDTENTHDKCILTVPFRTLKRIQTCICEKNWSAFKKMYQKFICYSLHHLLCLGRPPSAFTDVFDGLERYFPLLFAHRSLTAEACLWNSFWPLTVFLGIWCPCCQPVQLIVRKQVAVMLFACKWAVQFSPDFDFKMEV